VPGSKDTGVEEKEVLMSGRRDQGRLTGKSRKLQRVWMPHLCEAALLLQPGQDHSAPLTPAANCCSKQGALIHHQSLGNGDKVCRIAWLS
jgi:hypothetical protein